MTASPGIRIADAHYHYLQGDGAQGDQVKKQSGRDTPVFTGLDMALEGGRWTALLGPSGVGKSSLLRLIAGLHDGGDATGRIEAEDNRPLSGRIAYMAQQDLLLPWARVLDNVLLGYRLRGTARRARAELAERAVAMLERVGLAAYADARPGALSGGMRQRVALARTLMEDRAIVLMDEPFSALDALTRHRLQDMAGELLQGRTVLLVTHDPMEALRLAHRIEILSGRPAKLARDPVRPPGIPPRSTGTTELQNLYRDLIRRLQALEIQDAGQWA